MRERTGKVTRELIHEGRGTQDALQGREAMRAWIEKEPD